MPIARRTLAVALWLLAVGLCTLWGPYAFEKASADGLPSPEPQPALELIDLRDGTLSRELERLLLTPRGDDEHEADVSDDAVSTADTGL